MDKKTLLRLAKKLTDPQFKSLEEIFEDPVMKKFMSQLSEDDQARLRFSFRVLRDMPPEERDAYMNKLNKSLRCAPQTKRLREAMNGFPPRRGKRGKR